MTMASPLTNMMNDSENARAQSATATNLGKPMQSNNIQEALHAMAIFKQVQPVNKVAININVNSEE